MVGCIIVTGVFNNTTALGNAYGLSVVRNHRRILGISLIVPHADLGYNGDDSAGYTRRDSSMVLSSVLCRATCLCDLR